MKEEDIRKREVFNKYLALVKEDIERLFNNSNSFIHIDCPSCSSLDHRREFVKNSFSYVTCNKCDTLFVNPRPNYEELMSFYTQSVSTNYWIEEFFKPVSEVRRDKIFKPRAEYINKSLPEKSTGLIGDIGAGFGIFLEELNKYWPQSDLVAIEPSVEQAKLCRDKGLKVLGTALEEVDNYKEAFDLLSSFEVFEHLYDPFSFLKHSYNLLKPGGVFFMTTLSGKGFDIQVLWDRSKSINPPLHLNFFNPKSIVHLFKRCGFKDISVTTPGKLDWDIVEGMIVEEGFNAGHFWQSLATEGTSESKAALQEWISENNFSSHMQIVAVK